MPIIVDLAARRLQAGVGDLLGESEHRTIGFSGAGRSRLWIGQELHRRVQQEITATDESYKPEVQVSLEIEIDGWTVLISGRADGVSYRGDDPVRVDEIKTLHFAVDLYNLYFQERLDRYRNQVKLYGLMLSTSEVVPDLRLILVDIVTGDEKHEEVPWSRDSILAWLRQRIHRIVNHEKNRVEHLASLREASGELTFPFPAPRPAQTEIGAAINSALDDSRHLLVRAPTGSGKTAAALYPILKAAMQRGQRVFFLTAKTLQQKLAVETIQRMQPGGFRSLQLRAKSKMCAHTDMICHEEHCPYALEYSLKLIRSGLVDRLLDQCEHLDPDELFATGRDHEVCPFELSLDLLRSADLVVCDYNYVFDPTVGLGALLGGSSLENSVLIIDEAHNLVDRSREYYSPRLRLASIVSARSFCAGRGGTLFDKLDHCLTTLEELVLSTVDHALPEPGAGEDHAELPREELSRIRIEFDSLLLQYFVYKREHDLWIADDPVMSLFLDLARLQRVLELDGEEFVHLVGRSENGERHLRVFCRDAAAFVGEILDRSAGTIAMSATLEPFDFFRDLLGFDSHRTDVLHVRSPFPEENRLVMAIESVDTTYRKRQENFDPIANWLPRLIHPGHNALVLFPSYAFLSAVRDRLPPTKHTVLCQERGSSDADQKALLAALGNGESHIVMAVLGGIFAEGIDYPGRMLSQVVVVSPGLPQFNMERELLKAYYQDRHGHGFGYAYLIPGMTRVVQAAGRLIRSDDDRGVIILMGKRFIDQRYARLLPQEWIDGRPENLLQQDPEEAVRNFFSATD
ncbi:MAG: ATP-dependent DNA helicase [bacterium]|nr:ATP-dependent DNA helicase [bacterium]